METRANYVVIGLFTLAVVIGVFGFVYWFQNIGGTGERAFYRVVFEGSVSGLRTGATVLFNGIRVGEVTKLELNPQRPQQVVATVSIDKSVAVRPDTEIGLEFQGLTGIASLSLKGGNPSQPALAGDKDNPPILKAPPGATQDVTQTARDVMRRFDDFLAENQKQFHSTLENLDKFTGALARNSERPGKSHRRRGRQGRRDQRGGALHQGTRRQSRQAHRRTHRRGDPPHGVGTAPDRHPVVERAAHALDHQPGGRESRPQPEPADFRRQRLLIAQV